MNQLNFLTIANLFNNSIHSLRLFCEEVGQLADQQDQLIKERPFAQLSTELDVPIGELKAEAAAWEARLGIDVSQPWEPTNLTSLQQQALAQLNAEIKELAKINPEAATQLLFLLDSLSNVLPIQGELLRRGVLFNLWSYFESLITDLIRTYYLTYPNALSDKRSLTLSELRDIGTVEEAEVYLAAQEAETVQHHSLEEQLKYLTKPLNVDLNPLAQYRDALIEIALRRNLMVHNQGMVNHIYLSKAPRSCIQQEGIYEGLRLSVDDTYIFQAIDIVYLAGMILLQQSWRKWKKEELMQADFVLIHKGIYQALVDERYELTCQLANYAAGIKLFSEANARTVIINHAIALRELGEYQAMEQLLASVDWTACAAKYQIALLALRGENERLLDLLPKAVAVGDVKLTDLDKWPLFNPLRDDPCFISLLETLKMGMKAQ